MHYYSLHRPLLNKLWSAPAVGCCCWQQLLLLFAQQLFAIFTSCYYQLFRLLLHRAAAICSYLSPNYLLSPPLYLFYFIHYHYRYQLPFNCCCYFHQLTNWQLIGIDSQLEFCWLVTINWLQLEQFSHHYQSPFNHQPSITTHTIHQAAARDISIDFAISPPAAAISGRCRPGNLLGCCCCCSSAQLLLLLLAAIAANIY